MANYNRALPNVRDCCRQRKIMLAENNAMPKKFAKCDKIQVMQVYGKSHYVNSC